MMGPSDVVYVSYRGVLLKKNDISKCLWIFLIMIIRQYFVDCVIVLISEYRAQLQFIIFFIFCVVSSHQ